ncbi:MAG: hypothetical protein HZC11_05010 [Nitrospirae bacterium]|nr:hypothetical protein [Nitrospirota bacterium]
MFYAFPWDSLGIIWFFWWLKFSCLSDLSLNIHTYLAYPFGHDLRYMPFQYTLNLAGFLLTYFTDEIVAFNVIKLINFPLLALTVYLLIYYLTENKLVSACIGIVYSFAPFHTVQNIAHFANVYWVPLSILFLLKLLKEGGYRNGALFGLFWGLTYVDNAYYAYFIGLLMPIFAIFFLLKNEKRPNILKISFLKTFAVGFLLFSLIVLPMMYPMLKGMFSNRGAKVLSSIGIMRDFSDLFIFSAKPFDYLLPSKHNPFLGWLIPDFGMSPLKGHRYTEHTLYLGWSLILVAAYAFYCSLRTVGGVGVTKENQQSVYLFLVVAIVASILSAPPFIPIGDYQVNLQTREVIAEYKIYLPQYFLYKLFPMFRAYARIGAIVLLAVCVMAAFGLKEILNRINSQKGKYIFLSLFAMVIFVEYAEFPPFRLTKVKEPEVYKWLASQPEQFPIVEYPLGASDDPYTTYEYYFYQRMHKKYLVNGAVKGTPADEFRKEVVDVSKMGTVEKLQGVGVKYILIHKYKYLRGNEYIPLDWLTTPSRDKIFPPEYNDGKIPSLEAVADRLKLVKDFGDTAVYEIIKSH